MSDKRPFTTLNPLDVKKKYPKVYKNIIEWLKKSATEGNYLTEEMVHAFIYGNPRFLYDYFDDMSLVIWIAPDMTFIGNEHRYTSKEGSRKEIEEEAFEEAFKALEAKL